MTKESFPRTAENLPELRIKLSGKQLRILYVFCFKDFIILTHAFVKHISEVRMSEIN
ncbi:MAG: type II toxin-antitoxin system RelE/ParE family toxin [Nitrospirae bacterium]|nr:type II toxin-antitoxin system RelE/ParE family toxin [Nitrospirota bacterium]